MPLHVRPEVTARRRRAHHPKRCDGPEAPGAVEKIRAPLLPRVPTNKALTSIHLSPRRAGRPSGGDEWKERMKRKHKYNFTLCAPRSSAAGLVSSGRPGFLYQASTETSEKRWQTRDAIFSFSLRPVHPAARSASAWCLNRGMSTNDR